MRFERDAVEGVVNVLAHDDPDALRVLEDA